ncbi:MAG: FeoA family protein [Acidaminococcaceae bacterium]|jgi:ferrous iron transport protein A|nr:FeoA family protein [Acidaminococcaceae bacterium]MDD4722906.1 FeoA family protein [Acidaminococcaceae bacterium]
MPLVLAPAGKINIVKRIGGTAEIRQFLETLGFIVGSAVTVISENNGNIIVSIKNSRIAIGKEIAQKIII